MKIDLRAVDAAAKEIAQNNPRHDDDRAPAPAAAANDNDECNWPLLPFPDDWYATS